MNSASEKGFDRVFTPRESRFGDLLAHSQFRRFWIVGLVAAIGDQVFPICATVLLLDQGSGATAISVLMSVRAIAFLALLPIGGVVVDRIPRRALLVWGSFARSLICVGVFLSGERTSLTTLAILVFMMGVTEAFSGPAGSAIIPSILAPEQLQSANALRAMTARVASISGPGIAALITALIEPRFGFLITAAGFLFASIQLRKINSDVPLGAKSNFIQEMKMGFGFIRQRKWMMTTMIIMALQISILFGAEMVLLPVITKEAFDTSRIYPLAIATLSIGSFLSAYIASRVSVSRPGTISFLSWSMLSALLIALIFPVHPWFVLLCYFIGGVATQPMGIFWATALQREVPAELRGRVMSLDATLSGALVPVGMMAAGPASEYFGRREYMTACLVIFVALNIFALMTRGVGRFSDSQ